MGQTFINYNGVQIHHCTTKKFEQHVVYDDSGTDYLYTRFNIAVVGYVHANLRASISANSGVRVDVVSPADYSKMTKNAAGIFEDGATNNFNVIRARLAAPRKAFRMEIDAAEGGGGGTFLMDINAAPTVALNASFVDCNNGPKPQILAITHVVADNVFRIEWEVEVCRVECSDDGLTTTSNASGVLSNRWSMTDEIDNNAYTTRTIQGRLRILSAKVNPHSFRDLVVPFLNKYFRRDRVTFVATADGLNLDYTIVDKEIAYAAPFPATSWHFEIHSSMTIAMKEITTIDIRMSCPRTVDKTLLIMIAAQIIDARGFRTFAGGQTVIVREVTFGDIYGDNENSITAHALIEHVGADGNDAANLFHTAAQRLGRPPSNDFSTSVTAYTRDQSEPPQNWNPGGEQAGTTGIIGAFSARLQSACDFQHAVSFQALDPNRQTAPPATEYAMQATVLPAGVQLPSNHNTTAHIANPYTHYKMETRYIEAANAVQMPLASSFGPVVGMATSVVCNLARNMAKRVIRVSAERVGKEPQIPTTLPTTSGSSGVKTTALDRIILPMTRTLTVDGKYLYRTEYEMSYACDRPYKFNGSSSENLPIGLQPWIEDPMAVADNIGFSTNNQFDSNILPA